MPTLYTHKGIHIKSGVNLCDCLEESCSGCFMGCSVCASTKCGHFCRNNRNFESHGIQLDPTAGDDIEEIIVE